jgi:general secretion pathway protein G
MKIFGRLMTPSNSHAFSVLELLTVLAVMAALASLVIGAGRYAVESSNLARARGELAAVEIALATYQARCGDFPRTENPAELLQALIGRRDPQGRSISIPPMLQLRLFTVSRGSDPFRDDSAQLLDPWERPYRYIYHPAATGSVSSYSLYSAGPDGIDSTGDRERPENRDNVYAADRR